ncbi:hypothetical protein [Paenibacillus sp. GCM10027626]|uniref:hypothetical protein n=1 Tax=Paenibacillus sp. GCM10027626 TaxID=3273411 RepID=UPI00364248D5
MPKKQAKAKEVALHEKEVLTSELGAVVGKTPQWIRQLTRDGVLKLVGRGKYILGDAVQAYIEHVSGGKEEDNKPRFIDEKTEHERLKKERAALELSLLRGDLHKTEDVEKFVANMILSVKSKLQAIPTRLAPQLENESTGFIETSIRREINAALSGLTEYEPDKPEPAD